MKRFLFLIPFLCGIALATDVLPSNNYDSSAKIGAEIRQSYDITVNVVKDNDNNLATGTSYWSALAVPTKFKTIDARYASMEFAFIVDGNDHNSVSDGNDPNTSTFNFKIYAVRWFNSATVVCSGTASCGELMATREPNGAGAEYASRLVPMRKYVSGITNFVDNWQSCSLIDYTESNNGIARIKVGDIRGYGAVWCEITGITGSPGRIRCIATGW